ncbi:reverse transcriptase [Plakobranchus ocellatus]|uniref:Reverse transcriptase n=1 Tax=Plakobranchus ocellatus TaxID=259542 RepID=A0AAV4CVF2_9GAST|nr:reverse transcriptase [Plakobranchus ocellatus]
MWWPKTEGKGRIYMTSDKTRLEEDSKRMQKAVQSSQQGHWTSWEKALLKLFTWNEIWHKAPLKISFLIRAVYDFLASNANLLLWGLEGVPACPLCQG